MRFPHAAAIALVGWYLMLPPLRAKTGAIGLEYDYQAPLSQWTQIAAFDTARECQSTLADDAKSTDLETVGENGRCIEVDDRLRK